MCLDRSPCLLFQSGFASIMYALVRFPHSRWVSNLFACSKHDSHTHSKTCLMAWCAVCGVAHPRAHRVDVYVLFSPAIVICARLPLLILLRFHVLICITWTCVLNGSCSDSSLLLALLSCVLLSACVSFSHCCWCCLLQVRGRASRSSLHCFLSFLLLLALFAVAIP